MAASLDTADLLARQAAWIRRLARRLVRDAHLADDLAQDALLATVRRPPRDHAKIRGFLRRVLVNRVREHERSSRADRAREAARPPVGPAPDTAGLVVEVEIQRRLAGLMLQIEEPYRTALLLRFHADLPPRRIAARTGVPVATVKSRIQRGLAKLRSRLDGDFGRDRAAWLAALLPLTRPSAWPPAAAGAVAVAVAVAAGLATGLWLWTGDRDAAGIDPAAGIASGSGIEGSRRSPGAQGREAPPPVRRLVVADGRTAANGRSETLAASHTVRGWVIDTDNRPVPGLRVALEGSGVQATTGADGSFALSAAAERGRIVVTDSGWVAVRPASWSPAARLQPVVVVAPAVDLAGRVVDEWGRGVGDASVTLTMPTDFASRFTAVLDSSFEPTWTARTGADGAFGLAAAPAVAGARIQAAHPRYEPAVIAQPEHTDRALWIELRVANVPPGRALRGLVRRADGTAADRAFVSLGLATTPTDDRGAFVIDLARAGPARRLVAVEAGTLPATLDRPAPAGGARDGWPEQVELRLGPAALTIEGRVVDEHGRPRGAGTRVWLRDSTAFGVVGTVPVHLEPLMAGGSIPAEAIRSIAHDRIDPGGDESFGSALPAVTPDAVVHWTETDAAGRFEVRGLLPQDYVLCAVGPRLGFGAISEPIAAGARDVELVVAGDSIRPARRGRVVTRQGESIAGVRVTPWVTALSIAARVPGGHADTLRFFLGPSCETDSEGRFILPELLGRHVQLHLAGEAIVPSYAVPREGSDPDDLVIEVLARVHLDVAVTPRSGEMPDQIGVRDAAGRALTIYKIRPDGYSNLETVPLVGGRSGVVTTTSDAAVVELLAGSRVLESIPIQPRAGTTLRIER